MACISLTKTVCPLLCDIQSVDLEVICVFVRSALGATIAVRAADWTKDTEQIEKTVHPSVCGPRCFIEVTHSVL